MGARLVAAPASAHSVVASAATTTDPTLTAVGAQAVSEAGHIVDFYKALGLGASDVPAASQAQTATLSGVIDLLAAPASTPPLPTLAAPPTDCSDTGALVSYSQQVAAMNDVIDPDATTLGQETAYMYMSHFFDLPSIYADNTAYSTRLDHRRRAVGRQQLPRGEQQHPARDDDPADDPERRGHRR